MLADRFAVTPYLLIFLLIETGIPMSKAPPGIKPFSQTTLYTASTARSLLAT